MIINTIFCVAASIFVCRAARLLVVAHKGEFIRETAISLAIMVLHLLIVARSSILIGVGIEKIADAGLLLNYYLYLGSVIIQMLISDFVIKFVYDKIKTKKA